MATISYKCDTCKRSIELVENPQGFTVVGRCVITEGCLGRLYKTSRNPNNVRESYPTFVEGLDNYVPRRALFEFPQTLPSDLWDVTHNMGVLPATSVYLTSEAGLKFLDNSAYTVTPAGKNRILIKFDTKVTGIVQCIARSTVPIVPQTLPPAESLYQVSANGILTLAIPKYITHIRGSVPPVSPPVITPSITPSPTPSSTPVALPINICASNTPIQLEIEITKPNEDAFICFEDLPNVIDNRSPWSGWGEVLVGKRRNYCVRTANLLKLKVFGSANLKASDIPNGTRIRFLRIDFGDGRKEPISSRTLLMLLGKAPYEYVDKVKDQVVDVGELIGDTPNYFVYNDGELFLDKTKVEKSYPDISRVIFQAAPPVPSPSVTPTITPTSSIIPSVTPSVSATAIPPTPTPSSSALPPIEILNEMADIDCNAGTYSTTLDVVGGTGIYTNLTVTNSTLPDWMNSTLVGNEIQITGTPDPCEADPIVISDLAYLEFECVNGAVYNRMIPFTGGRPPYNLTIDTVNWPSWLYYSIAGNAIHLYGIIEGCEI